MQEEIPGFQTQRLSLNIEGIAVELYTVTNIDELYERLVAKGDDHEDVRDERIPYWADLWHSATALAKYVVREGLVQSGMRVTEIGCGLGLTGIVAGKLGAEVTFSDYMDDALDFARLNWTRNFERPARFVKMDWRNPDPALAGDLVLAADVAYERRAFGPLLHTFDLFCRQGSTVLLSEPNRDVAKDFFEMLSKNGFQITRTVVSENFKTLIGVINILTLKKPPE